LGGQSVGAEFDRTIVELSEAQVSCEAPDCEKKNKRKEKQMEYSLPARN
jgi:hypothetical protein